ncbi:MAG: hypothetical protein RI904_2039, partial [Pseudomonadota bacterium]
RTKQPCQNPAAFGMRSCRMHGAHRPNKPLCGNKHPNYLHGNATKQARREHSIAMARIYTLEAIGFRIGMFTGARFVGRKCKQNI